MKRAVKRFLTIGELAALPGLKLLCGRAAGRVTGAYVSDLPSSALAKASAGDAWITTRTEPVVFAVAARRRMAAVILTEGARPAPGTLARAAGTRVAVLTSEENTFDVAGKLYAGLEHI